MSKPTVYYFGYGSNLWRYQMRQRCPTSVYLGIARLKGYKWIIYDRGYANIVQPSGEKESSAAENDYSQQVWGLVYALQDLDEAQLDMNEGVPSAYSREWIECEFWPATESKERAGAAEALEDLPRHDTEGRPDISLKPTKVGMLVYINRSMTTETDPKKEYIYRMNMGINDALKEGMPRQYVEQVLRTFIPSGDDGRLADLARRQASNFEDET